MFFLKIIFVNNMSLKFGAKLQHFFVTLQMFLIFF
jgi:hypothetical protein